MSPTAQTLSLNPRSGDSYCTCFIDKEIEVWSGLVIYPGSHVRNDLSCALPCTSPVRDDEGSPPALSGDLELTTTLPGPQFPPQ